MNAKVMFRVMRINEFAAAYRICCNRYCTETYTLEKKKIVHPYRNIHPWKSEIEFADSLLENVIYNNDGIIAINKPYGISILNTQNSNTNIFNVVKAKNYDIQSVLPYMAKVLNVPALIPCMGSEKYISGLYIFGINNKICMDIIQAKSRAFHLNQFRKYWAITTRIPNEIKGMHRLGLTLQTSSNGNKKPIILTNWSKNAVKKNEVKILNINYKILSNSTLNLSSLLEIEASARKWHAVRLFSSTMLYSPILGDNYYGSRVQEIMGTWIKVNPFSETSMNLPKLNPELLNLLNVTQAEQDIIPVHLHLKSIYLKSFGYDQKDILLEAPLHDYFEWTCKQLMFKINLSKEDHYMGVLA